MSSLFYSPNRTYSLTLSFKFSASLMLQIHLHFIWLTLVLSFFSLLYFCAVLSKINYCLLCYPFFLHFYIDIGLFFIILLFSAKMLIKSSCMYILFADVLFCLSFFSFLVLISIFYENL